MAAPNTRRTIVLVAVMAVTWWTVLGLLAALTANPVVLNSAQILEARLIVEARLSSTSDNRIELIEVIASDVLKEPSGEIEISNLSELHPVPEKGGSHLFPLVPSGSGTWRVIPFGHRDRKLRAVIYPANDVTRARLKQILERAKRQILDRPIELDRHFVQVSIR